MKKTQRPPQAPLSIFEQIHKTTRDLADAASSKAGAIAGLGGEKIVEGLHSFDERFDISTGLKTVGDAAGSKVKELDARFDVSGKAQRLAVQSREKMQQAQESLSSVADKMGAPAAADKAADSTRRLRESSMSTDAYQKSTDASKRAYSAAREVVVELLAPDLPTFDHDELLRCTERELTRIAACIMQINVAESSALGRQFSRAVFAKASGAATAAGILALVSAFGTAGTGTAIATLSGAAATSASLAFVGSLLGGGVAAGAALTGGVSLIVGLVAYKALASERRPIESLSELEQWVVQSCWALAGLCAEYRKAPYEISVAAMIQLLESRLQPLYARVQENMDALCEPLDVKNAVSLRQHALPRFKSAVLHRLSVYLGWLHSSQGQTWLADLSRTRPGHASGQGQVVEPVAVTSGGDADLAEERSALVDDQRAMYAIGGVFAALLSRQALDGSVESEMVVSALRRSASRLNDATDGELTDYLSEMSDRQRSALASNVKGIYHELSFVWHYNEGHTDTFARLYESTNHAGADAQILDSHSGEILGVVQLKAVSSPQSVNAHLARYPDIPVHVTDEVASKFDRADVTPSGFNNDTLTARVHVDLDKLTDHTILHRAENTAVMSMGISSVQEVIQMMRGERRFPDAVLKTASRVGVAAGATAMAALLFG
jgi:hypothetical protein